MSHLRLVADDLTGALDSAAAFSPVIGPIAVGWSQTGTAPTGSLALSTGMRDQPERAAVAAAGAAARLLACGGDAIAFFKVDSLLRGHAGAELATILRAVSFDQVIIAPAIPFQARATRMGRQHRRIGDTWQAVGEDIVATLRHSGFDVVLRDAGAPAPQGISFWNTETDQDLDMVVDAAHQSDGSILWVGAAGLAGALARRLGGQHPRRSAPRLPLLGLIGTDNAVMAAQLAEVAKYHIRITDDREGSARIVRDRLTMDGVCFASCELLSGVSRSDANGLIAARFSDLCRRIDRPAALFASGGETLGALCQSLGVSALSVDGEFEPGIPCSHLCGGPWNALPVFSKSGAFGSPDALSRLLAASFP